MELPDNPSTLSRIGDFAMTAVEAIEDRFGEDVLVGAVAIVADVHCADSQGHGINPVVTICSDPRAWVQAALIGEAAAQADHANEQRVEAVEADHEAQED